MINTTAPNIWVWTPSRYRLARNLSDGDTYRVAGTKENLSETTVKTYMREVQEFRAYVDKITLENEMASRAGILRRLMNVAELKLPSVIDDKSTYLDCLKFMRELAKENDEPDTELIVTFK